MAVACVVLIHAFVKFQGFAHSKDGIWLWADLGTPIFPALASVSSCQLAGGEYCLEIWEQISVAFASLNRDMGLSNDSNKTLKQMKWILWSQ